MFGNKPPQEQPLYTSNSLGFWIRVYHNRVEFNAGPGIQSIPLGQISSIQIGMPLLMQITLETTGGHRYKIPTNHKKAVQQAIYDAQSRFLNPGSTSSASVADEIAKLHDLKERRIISQEDFEKKKKQLLS